MSTKNFRVVLSKKTTATRCNTHPTTTMRWATDPRYAHLGFPKPVQISDGRVGFFEHEIDEWLASRPRIGGAQSGEAA